MRDRRSYKVSKAGYPKFRPLQAGVRTSSSPFGTCIGVRLTGMMLISSTPRDGPWMDPIQTKQTKISVTCLLEEDRGNALGTCSLHSRYNTHGLNYSYFSRLVMTMKRQIAHMIRYKYIPFTIGRQVNNRNLLVM
ncbi:unnamed protein product [Rhodiola kirilowii]